MKQVFEPWSFGNVTLKNRLVRSATLENAGAENGVITPFLKEIYGDLAKGGVSLIITGMMGIGPNACLNGSMVDIRDDSFPALFSDITQSVHALGGKIAVQLGHCGALSRVIDRGDHPYSPSDYKKGREISTDDLHMLAQCFGEAALRCKEAGADAVQIHGAHGYFVSEFLSPYCNQRTDEYGGCLENRARFLFEIYDSIRSHVGDNYPIFLKINSNDLTEPGLQDEECAWICRELDQKGLDAVEISGGLSINLDSAPTQPLHKERQGFFADAACSIADQVSMPVISVGGYRSMAAIENVLNRGNVVAVSLCRTLIRQPDLPGRWYGGDRANATCISCNQCFKTARHGCVLKV